MEPPHVTLVVEPGRGSMGEYSRRLAAQLPIATLDIGAASGLGKLAPEELERLLAATPGLVHLPHQHLARHAGGIAERLIVTVHDLILLSDMEGSKAPLIGRPAGEHRALLERDYDTIRRARAVVAVSRTTAREVVERLGVPSERVFVVSPGVDPAVFRPRRRRPRAGRYVLFVGSEQPRKNLAALLRALAHLRRTPELADVRLVKVGRAGRRNRLLRQPTAAEITRLGLEDAVTFLGNVPERRLARLYSGAGCLVLPSLDEGFGLPPVEAMACGCPCVVSNRGALPETAGPAALTVEPDDPEALAEAIVGVMADQELRTDLRSRGFAQAAGYTWWATGQAARDVYRRLGARIG